jgi:DNA repair protein RadD
MQLKLRGYQEDAVSVGILKYCKENPAKSPVLELPTGSGKSVVIAEFCSRLAARGKRSLVLCRQKELVEQNHERFVQLTEGKCSAGIYCAGLGRKDTVENVIFATAQSVGKSILDLGQINAIIVDEAHQIPLKSDSQYGKILSAVREFNDKCRLIGLTATPYRTGSGLVYGEGTLFDDLSFSVPVKKMIREGNIVDWVLPEVTEVDVSDVKIRGNEFDAGELGEAFTDKLENNISEILALTGDRSKVLIFATTVKHGEAVKKALDDSGNPCGFIHGESLPAARDALLGQFCSGPLKYLCNVGVLTTGFDCPSIDAVAICRSTQSAGLFYQMLGRGMRKNEGKEDFIVLDFGGNFARHGDPKEPNFGRGEKAKKREACPECDEHVLAEDEVCGSCGHILKYKECPQCLQQVPSRTDVCKVKLDPSNLFSDLCGFDFTLRRCGALTPEGTKCLTVLDDHDLICPACLKEKKRREVGEFERSCAAKKPKVFHQFDVTNVSYAFNKPKQEGKLPTLRVNYTTHIRNPEPGVPYPRSVCEWVCLEHEGWAGRNAANWWRARGLTSVPETIDEAVYLAAAGALREPISIVVEDDGKWKRPTDYDFGGREKPKPVYIDDEDVPF